MNITKLELSKDLKTLSVNLVADSQVASGSVRLMIHINECFKQSCVDVSKRLVDLGNNIYTADIPVCDLQSRSTEGGVTGNCGFNQDIYDGIFAVEAIEAYGSEVISVVRGFINTFYLSVCSAHYILDIQDGDSLAEANMLYLLIDAAKSYIEAGMIEQGIEAFEKAKAMCESQGKEYYETNIAECSQGSGCWITGGVYTKQ